MKLVIQRVKKAEVKVSEKTVGKINKGFLVLLGITHTDTKEIADNLVDKLIKLRIFDDENDKINLSLQDVNGELLIVSQFTLYADSSHGHRPSFTNAAKPAEAEQLYNYFVEQCRKQNIKTETGIFGADMQVSLINDGPVTIIMEKQ